jgi:hypothetical protein
VRAFADKALLREQGGGLIIQFSSMGGRVGGSAGIASQSMTVTEDCGPER